MYKIIKQTGNSAANVTDVQRNFRTKLEAVQTMHQYRWYECEQLNSWEYYRNCLRNVISGELIRRNPKTVHDCILVDDKYYSVVKQ